MIDPINFDIYKNLWRNLWTTPWIFCFIKIVTEFMKIPMKTFSTIFPSTAIYFGHFIAFQAGRIRRSPGNLCNSLPRHHILRRILLDAAVFQNSSEATKNFAHSSHREQFADFDFDVGAAVAVENLRWVLNRNFTFSSDFNEIFPFQGSQTSTYSVTTARSSGSATLSSFFSTISSSSSQPAFASSTNSPSPFARRSSLGWLRTIWCSRATFRLSINKFFPLICEKPRGFYFKLWQN